MRFEELRLENFKPYGNAELSLSDGVTVIHGVNGSGKSSLLEACFFALYGSRALEGTLGDVVTNGEDETLVELGFSHEGVGYRIERRLRDYDDRTDHQCSLEGEDGTMRDGAREVRRFITELLRMDAEAFLNCAYVRQGEVNKLINASPSERQDTIDDLLQLGVLEEYRERAGDARLGVEDVLNAKRAVLEERDERIERLERKNLHATLNQLESDLATVDEDLDHYESQREEAETTRAEAEQILDEHEANRERLASIDEDVESLEETIREAESERETCREGISDAREQIETLRAELEERLADAGIDAAEESALETRRQELDERESTLREDRDEAVTAVTGFENQSSNLKAKAEDLRERAEEAESEAERSMELAREANADLDERESRLEELDEEATALLAEFDANEDIERGGATERLEALTERRNDVRERVAELETELKNARERVAEAEELLEAGRCPECGQPVDESPHVDRIDDRRERVTELKSSLEETNERARSLDAEIEATERLVEAEERLGEIETTRELLEERIAEAREEIDRNRETADRKHEAAEDLRTEAESTREIAAEKREAAAEAKARVETVEEQLREIDVARDRLAEIDTRLETIADLEAEIERLRERRETLDELNDERRERLAEKRERREELREAVDEDAIASARERKRNAVEYLENVVEELERLGERRDELQSRIGAIQGEIRTLETLRSEREELAGTVEALESVHGETSDLETMYGELRTELRQRNVRTLERMVNETFELVYGNDAYSHIELDGDYELTVYQKDGEALDPEQLSGGERALFNLALRCAIYRLLAEGIEGAAPTPPLILDEPTVFLDTGHVARLVDLVEEMREFGVRQIVIVSHDDELIGAADDLLSVEKDPRTNRSTVTRPETDVAGAIPAELDD